MVKSAAHQQPATLLGWMGSLADPTRLRLLHLLERHELGVDDLTDILSKPQSTVSRHLKVLADQKFVRSRREATTHLYRTVLDELDPAARRLWLLTREQTENWSTLKQDELRLARRLRQRESETQVFFATAATDWDKLRAELYGTHFSIAAMLALLPPTYVVADLGCGTGAMAAEIAPHVKQVIGIDNSAAMLKAARKRTTGLPNVDLRRGELHTLPIDSLSCDAALMILSLTYIPDPLPALKEISRLLKPAGRAVIIDLLPHDREDFRHQLGQQHLGFAASDLERLLLESGFSDIKFNPLPPEPNSQGPALFQATATKLPTP